MSDDPKPSASNRLRKTYSLSAETAGLIVAEATSRHDDNESAALEAIVDFYREAKRGPLTEIFHHLARVKDMLEHHGRATHREKSLGVDWVLPGRDIAVEAKTRCPESTIKMTAAIATTVAKDKPTQVWIVVPDTITRAERKKFEAYAEQLPFEGTPVLVFPVKEADDTLAQMDGKVPDPTKRSPQSSEG